MHPSLKASVAVLALGSALPAHAQSASAGAAVELEPITVAGQSTADALRAKHQPAPQASDVVESADLRPAASLASALSLSPGVVVQQFFGGNDQPRVQIRGSGLQQNPTERGLLILQDGMPINRADGSFIIGVAAPAQAEAIEVFRGAAANRLGAAYLGGALNFISPTAQTRAGTQLSFGAGRFGKRALAGSHGVSSEQGAALLRFEFGAASGARDHNSQRRAIVGGSYGLTWGDGVATQVFFNHADLAFDIAGPLSASDLARDPSLVNQNPAQGAATGNGTGIGPNVVRDKPKRETEQSLFGTRSTLERGAHRFDLGVSYSETQDLFTFPIASGLRETDGWDSTVMARYALMPEGAELPLLEATLNHSFGQADRGYYYNLGGSKGAQFGANSLKARTTSLHLGANMPLSEALLLAPALSYTHATRDNRELWAGRAGTAGDTSYAKTYEGWSPALALRWQPQEGQSLWVSYAHSFDAPTSDDLLATVGGTVNTNPTGLRATSVEAQTAKTLELGWRGEIGDYGWDAVAYHSKIDNELLQLNTSSGASYITNADKTVHNGLELGLTAALSPKLRGRLAYTMQDFRFDGDATRGDNRLAGAPRNIVKAQLDWQPREALTLSAAATWRDEIAVDNANTAWADDVTLLDLSARYALSARAVVVAEVTNVTDETYASAVLAADRAVANGAAYLAGEGRAAYLGVKLSF